MTISHARQVRGTSIGGQFRATLHSEAPVVLGAPSVNKTFVEDRARELNRFDYLNSSQCDEITARLNDSRDFSDRNILALADEIHLRDHGHTASDARNAGEALSFLRDAGQHEHADSVARIMGPKTALAPAAVAEAGPAPDGVTAPVPSSDPRVQAGQVFDQIEVEGWGTFHRRRAGVGADTPYAMRFQANRKLSDDENRRFAGLVGYAYSATVAGESLSDPYPDSHYSFVVSADMTKSRRDDLGIALEEFEEQLPIMLQEGSPVRKTDRKGPGTAGTRLVDGFNDPDLKFEVYYDEVYTG